MNVLCIGDVVGSIGCQFLRAHLPHLKKMKQVDIVIVNGENSADGNGITPASAEFLFLSGADVITTGNHCFRRKEMYERFDQDDMILRPANYLDSVPGKGFCIVDKGRIQIGVVNLRGTAFMEPIMSPFVRIDEILKSGILPKITIVDFHAEATGEKRAMGFYLDGRVSAIFGTHTHVQTSDSCVLPKGTGYITDVGMAGPVHSVLGVKPELVIEKLRTGMPVRFENADGACQMDCVLFEIDEKTGKTVKAEQFSIR